MSVWFLLFVIPFIVIYIVKQVLSRNQVSLNGTELLSFKIISLTLDVLFLFYFDVAVFLFCLLLCRMKLALVNLYIYFVLCVYL